MEIKEHTNEDGLQSVHFRVRSQRNARRLYLAFETKFTLYPSKWRGGAFNLIRLHHG
jgi:hypothetical protein